jgi:hypothetical protein
MVTGVVSVFQFSDTTNQAIELRVQQFQARHAGPQIAKNRIDFRIERGGSHGLAFPFSPCEGFSRWQRLVAYQPGQNGHGGQMYFFCAQTDEQILSATESG